MSLSVVSLDGTAGKYITYDPGFSTLTTTGFTVELWVYAATNSNYTAVFRLAVAAGVQANWYAFNQSASEMDSLTISIRPFYQNTWTHVAYSSSATGAVKVYLNGVYYGADSFTPSTSKYNVVYWGASNLTTEPNSNFIGKYSEIRFWNTARTAAQIYANYKSSFVSAPDATLLCNISSHALNNQLNTSTGVLTQSNGTTATLQGYVSSNVVTDSTLPTLSVITPNPLQQFTFNGTLAASGSVAVAFDSTLATSLGTPAYSTGPTTGTQALVIATQNQYLALNYSSALDFDYNISWSIGGWFYDTNGVGFHFSNNSGGVGIQSQQYSTTANQFFNGTRLNYPQPLATSTWQHRWWTYNGSILKVYVNGTLMYTTNAGDVPQSTFKSGAAWWLMRNRTYGASNNVTGMIADMRWYSGVIAPALAMAPVVLSGIAFTAGVITPCTTPFSGGTISAVTVTNYSFTAPLSYSWTSSTGGTAITDTTLAAKTNLNPATYTLTVTDSSSTPQTSSKTFVLVYVLSAVILDGSFPKFISYDPGYQITSSGITIESWLYPTSAPSYNRWFELNIAYGNLSNYIECYFSPGSSTLNMSGAGSTNVPFNTWTHIALTATQGGNLVLYKNGVQQSTGSTGLTTALYASVWWGKSAYVNDTGATFIGRMAENRFWSTVRTAAQIAAAYKVSYVSAPDSTLLCNVSSAAIGSTSTGILPQLQSQTATLQGFNSTSVAADTGLNALVSTANYMSASSTDCSTTGGTNGSIGAVAVLFTGAVAPVTYTWTTTSSTPIYASLATPANLLQQFTFNGNLVGTGSLGLSLAAPTTTLGGTPTYSSGPVAGVQALNLSTYSSYLQVAFSAALAFNYTAPFSFGGWFYMSSKTGQVLDMDNCGGGPKGVQIITDVYGAGAATAPTTEYVQFFGNNFFYYAPGTVPSMLNRWIHKWVVFDGTNLTLYHNGSQIATQGLGIDITSPNPWQINHVTANASSMIGMVADLRWYSGVVSATVAQVPLSSTNPLVAHTGLGAGAYTLVASDSSSTPLTLSASFFVGEPLSYTYSVVNSNGATGSVAIVSAGKTNYLWSTGATTASISGLGPGTYTCVLSSGSYTSTISAFVQSANATALTVLRCNSSLVDTGSLSLTLGDASFLLNGAPVYTTGPYAGLQALAIPKKGILSLPYSSSLDFTAAASWCFGGWFKVSSYGPNNYAYVGYNSKATSGAGYNFILSSTNQFYAQRTAGTEQTSTAANSTSLQNVWVHLWVTYSASNATMTTYINGVAKSTSSSTSTLLSGARWQIASAVLNQANSMACAVADLRWYSGILDPVQTMKNYAPILFSGGAVSDASSNTGYDGAISAVTAVLGTATAPVLYSWSSSFGATTITDTTLSAKTGLAAGQYTLSGVGANGVLATQVFTVGAPLVLTSSTTPATLSNNGTAAVYNAGSGVVAYLWSTGATTATLTALALGNYTCAVSCGSYKASITLTITGTPLSTWSPAINYTGSAYTGSHGLQVSSQSLTVAPLLYTASFTIECYGYATSTGYISNLLNIVSSTTNKIYQNNNTLFCVNNGVTTSVTAGGNMTWFAWNHLAIGYDAGTGKLWYGVNGSVASLTVGVLPITAGTAISFIMNNSGYVDDLRISSACLYTSTYSVPNLTASLSNSGTCLYYENFEGATTAVSALQVSFGAASDNTVIGAANGSISNSALISAGVAPYSVTWTSSIGATVIATADLAKKSGLLAGTYSVVVKDSAQQTTRYTWTIGEPLGTITATAYPTAGGFDGSATLAISGTAVPVCYWSNGKTGTSISGLRSGSYSVNVYSGGYSGTATVTVTGFDPLTLQPTWSSTPLITTSQYHAGTRSLDLSTTQNKVIIPALNLAKAWTVEAFINTSNSNSTLSFYDLINLDSVFVNNGRFINLLRSLVLPASQYVGSSNSLNLNSWNHVAFSIDPVNSLCYVSVNGSTNSMVLDSTLKDTRTPLSLFSGSNVSNGYLDSLRVSQAVLYTAGSYTVPDDTTWLSTNANVVYYENFDFTIVPGVTSDTLGTIAATTVTGGTAPLSFTWTSTGSAVTSTTAGALTGLSAGAYTLNIKDANNVKKSYTYYLYAPLAVTLTATASSTGSNGSVISTCTGGGVKTFTWSAGGIVFATTPNVFNIAAGTYTCTVTTPVSTVTVSAIVSGLTTPVVWTRGPQSLRTTNIGYTGTSCLDTTQVAPGYFPGINIQGFTYLSNFTIEGFVNAQTYSALFSGSSTAGLDGTFFYQTSTLALFFNNGGTIAVSTPAVATGKWIHVAFGWDASINKCWSSVNGVSAISQYQTGSMALIADSRPLNIMWRDATSPVYTYGYLDCLRVTQSLLYTSPTYAVPDPSTWSSGGLVLYVEDFEPIKITAVVTAAATFGASSGSITTISVSSGIAPYVYSWSSGLSADISAKTGLQAGKYTLTVVDSAGATTNKQFTVLQPLSLTATTKKITTGGNGSATVVALGGTGIYTYLWSNGATTATTSGLAAGTYSCTVTSGYFSSTTSATVTGSSAGTAYWLTDVNKLRSTAKPYNGSYSLNLTNVVQNRFVYPRLMIPALNFAADFTFEMYIYMTSANNVLSIFGDSTNSNLNCLMLYSSSFYDITAANVQTNLGINSMASNAWVHVSFTYVAATTSWNFGVAGNNSVNLGRSSMTTFNGTRPFDLFFRSDSGSYTTGYIDCIRVTQSALYTASTYTVPTPAAMAASSSLYFENFENYIS